VMFQPEPMPQPAPPPPAAAEGAARAAGAGQAIPPEAIIAVYEDLKQAMSGARPHSFILSAEHYEELLKRLERLEKPAAAGRREVFLHACRMVGKVEPQSPSRMTADLKMELELRTTTPDVILPLGLKGIRLTRAAVDGETPVWSPSNDGLALLLKQPRVYQLTLQMQPPVTQVGAELRLLIEGLPQAAVTTLDLTVPGLATAAQVVGSGPVQVEAAEGGRSRLRSDALGVLGQLDLRWQVPNAEAEPSASQIVVQADAQVSLEDTSADTEVRIKLEARKGSFPQLRFRVPAGVTLLQVEAEPRGEGVDFSFEPGSDTFLVRPRRPYAAGQPSAELRLRYQQAYPDRPGATMSVGILELLDVPHKQQGGTIVIQSGSERRMRFQPVGAFRIDPREVPGSTRPAIFACRYWQQPARIDINTDANLALPLQVVARPLFNLAFNGRVVRGSFQWEFTPRGRAACQEVEIRWPGAFTLDRNSLLGGPVEFIAPIEGSQGLVRVRLNARQSTRFVIKAEGILPLGDGELHQLDLPQVFRVLAERDGRTEPMQLLMDRGELHTTCQGVDLQLLSASPSIADEQLRPLAFPLRASTPITCSLNILGPEDAPRLEIAAQPLRHQVTAVADVCITSKACEIEETLSYKFANGAPPELWLRVPRVLQGRLQLSLTYPRPDGAVTTVETALLERGPRPLVATEYLDRLIVLPNDVGDTCQLRATAMLELQAAANPFDLPLIAHGPNERLAGLATVRIWTSAEVRATLADAGGWLSGLPAFDEARLLAPQLLLRSASMRTPLQLIIQPQTDTLAASLVVERALFEVAQEGDGRRAFRGRLRLNPVRVESLVLGFPIEGFTPRIEQLLLNHEEVRVDNLMAQAGSSGFPELTIPLAPHHLRGPLLVELAFSLPSLGLTAESLHQPLPTILVPQAESVHEVCWRLQTGKGRMPILLAGAAEPGESWRWQGWLRPPQPIADQLAANRWIDPDGRGSRPESAAAAFSFKQRGDLSAPVVLSCSQSLWLLAGSMAVLMLGVIWYYLPTRLGVVFMVPLLVGFIVLAVVAPQVWVAVIYSAQPGLIVAVLLLGLVWVQQQRWRRRVVMLPGFKRVAPGSSRARLAAARVESTGEFPDRGMNGAPEVSSMNQGN